MAGVRVQGAQRWSKEQDELIRPCRARRPRSPRWRANLGVPDRLCRIESGASGGAWRPRWPREEGQTLLAIKLTPYTERYAGESTLAEVAARLGVTEIAAKSRYDRLRRKAGHQGSQWTDDGYGPSPSNGFLSSSARVSTNPRRRSLYARVLTAWGVRPKRSGDIWCENGR